MSRVAALDLYVGCSLLLALAELTERQRHVVVAHLWRGLTFDEIARELGVGCRTNAGAAFQEALRSLERCLGCERERLVAVIA